MKKRRGYVKMPTALSEGEDLTMCRMNEAKNRPGDTHIYYILMGTVVLSTICTWCTSARSDVLQVGVKFSPRMRRAIVGRGAPEN